MTTWTIQCALPPGMYVDEQIVFGYQGDGSDLIVATPVVDSADIKIQVQHVHSHPHD